jgi:predicted nucleic acid-binding protein
MIVFDSSTLILLAKADLLEVFLVESKMRALIPAEVAREVGEERQSADALLIRRLIAGKRIAIEPLKNRTLFDELRRELGIGTGEAEAIALAVAKKAKLVATDDKKAIDACKLARVPFTTALAILTRLYEKGVVSRQEASLKLSGLERYGRYKKSMIAAVLARLEEE